MIKVAYKCRCMQHEAEVEVPERPPGSDLMIWMGVMRSTLGMDHAYRSPGCIATELEYAKIPVAEGAEGIGEKPRLN